MPVTVRMLDLGPLRKWITPDDMRAAGQLALTLQRDRIARGEGSRGRPMKRYSKSYKAQLADEGRPTDKRTLRRTGKMLDSRQVKGATAVRATVGFAAPEKYMFVQQATTPFVKATKDERNQIRDYLIERVKARIKQNLAEARSRVR